MTLRWTGRAGAGEHGTAALESGLDRLGHQSTATAWLLVLDVRGHTTGGGWTREGGDLLRP